MNRFFPGRLATLIGFCGALLLQGCAVVTAPGFDFPDAANRTSITLGQYVAADPTNPPQGVITPITPQLVRAARQQQPAAVPTDVQALFAAPEAYTIAASDILNIVVYNHPELLVPPGALLQGSVDPTGVTGAPGFIVDKDGYIFYPHARRVKVGGLTESQASEVIENAIKHVIRDPQVTVRVASFRSRRAYVEGEVRTPGAQVFTDVPMTLTEGINRAGGVTVNGDRSFVTLTRGDTTTTINLMRMQQLGVNPNRILLQNGDFVVVRHRDESKVFVMGEILRPSALQMRNGRLTLNEALGEAGGPNLITANTSQIYVIRDVGQDSPAVFHLNAANPTALALAESFPLRPRDVVYVDPVPLVAWNRIVNLIFPSANALLLGRQVVSP
jgi:polysaccharide export outer membrane protein